MPRTPAWYRLLALMANGRFHSGSDLGRRLGVGRSAVWKQVRALEAMGLEVYSVRGRGHRLAEPVELLEHERVLAALDARARRLLAGLEILPEVDSTNRHLLACARRGYPSGYACLAERQTAGRGRRGRAWVTPDFRAVPLSVLWRFDSSPESLQGLSLAAGVGAARALAACGVGGVSLKWPNDVYRDGAKLGGILIEMEGDAAGPWRVVVGVGLNHRVPPADAARIDQRWTDLAARGAGDDAARTPPDRNQVAGRLLRHLLEVLDAFAARGLAPLLDEWRRLDLTRGRPVEVRTGEQVLRGEARGVDETGALLLASASTVRRVVAGEVTLRVEA